MSTEVGTSMGEMYGVNSVWNVFSCLDSENDFIWIDFVQQNFHIEGQFSIQYHFVEE